MTRRCAVATLLLTASAGVVAEISSAAADVTNTARFFHARVEPILITHCLQCHGANRKGELDLRTRDTLMRGGESGEVIVAGHPEESKLYDYVNRGEMPPKKEKLSERDIAVLKRWIAGGAFFPDRPIDPLAVTTDRRAGYDWWSLRPLARELPPRPPGIPARWRNSPIDRFIDAKLVERGLTPSPPADRRTLIRRASYDLLGLPPAPEDVRAFVRDDRPDAYERLLDRLLASPHYGEQWGRHWLDVVRFGESTGFERNVIVNNAWPFRDYIIRSLNADKPFRQMVVEQLAGDIIGAGDANVEVASTFLVCGPYDNVGNLDPRQAAQIRANTIDDMIRTTAESFLGLTVGCGRCHDHKFDPISQRDYYSLYATFAGVYHGSRVVASEQRRRRRQQAMAPLIKTRDQLARRQAELENRILARADARRARYEARWVRPAVDRTGTEETWEPVEAKWIRLMVAGVDTNPNAASGYRIDEFEVWTADSPPRNVALASAGATASGASRTAGDFAGAYSAALAIDGRFGAQWLASGPVLTITLAKPAMIRRAVFSSDRLGAAGTQPIAAFPCEYRLEVSRDGRQWTEVARSSDRKPVSAAHRRKRMLDLVITPAERTAFDQLARERAVIERQLAAIPPLPSWWVGTRRQPKGPQHVFLGGNPQRQGEPVVPASIRGLEATAGHYQLPADAPEGERRLALARWLVAPHNPLTPRVLANRLWHYHFGTGIVDTPSDFGFMGGRPTHPKLLDWLARQIVRGDWRLKRIQKQIMVSQAYRQSSANRAEAAKIDAGSRTLWRFPPRRLSAEEVRDTMLSVAGALDCRVGGPGFRLYRYLEDNVATYMPLDRPGPETYRRAVYHQNARAARVDLLTDFDCPDNAFSVPRRVATTTPLQALTLMNHRFTLDMAAALARRIEQDAGAGNRPGQVERAFTLVFSRRPTAQEQTASQRLIQAYGPRAFCRALLNTNEMLYVY